MQHERIILISPRRVDNGKEAQSEEGRQESCQKEKGSSQEKEGHSQEEKIKRFNRINKGRPVRVFFIWGRIKIVMPKRSFCNMMVLFQRVY